MSKITDKVSYIRGLAEGMKLDQNTNEGKLLGIIIEVMSEMAAAIDELEEANVAVGRQTQDPLGICATLDCPNFRRIVCWRRHQWRRSGR